MPRVEVVLHLHRVEGAGVVVVDVLPAAGVVAREVVILRLASRAARGGPRPALPWSSCRVVVDALRSRPAARWWSSCTCTMPEGVLEVAHVLEHLPGWRPTLASLARVVALHLRP